MARLSWSVIDELLAIASATSGWIGRGLSGRGTYDVARLPAERLLVGTLGLAGVECQFGVEIL
jgi:hypothetical protein